ncbi:MAG: glycosyltransferase family 2 protein [Planctomycetota bacterium]|nr:glycosyltransferase family 2 protein [Planctomycetota bacterium]
MSEVRITFIITAFNNRDVLDACLTSLRAQSISDWHCIVVDDCSTDGTEEFIREKHPWVRVMRNPTNIGPSRGRNLAIAATTSPLLAFLDSDTVLAPDWLEILLNALEADPTIGIVGGMQVYAARPDRINACGGRMSRLGLAWNNHDGEPAASVTEAEETLWLASAACIVRREVLDQIGHFDDEYFYGYEDSDLGWRAVLAGWRCVSIPAAVVQHRVNETVSRLGPRIAFNYCKNRFRSVLKNYSLPRLLLYTPLYLAFSAIDLVRPPRRAKARALLWNLRHLPDTLRLRARVQRARAVPDRHVLRLIDRRLLPDRTRRGRHQSAIGDEP